MRPLFHLLPQSDSLAGGQPSTSFIPPLQEPCFFYVTYMVFRFNSYQEKEVRVSC